MTLRHHTAGNDRPWQTRPSDHVLGSRSYWHGKIIPLHKPSLFERLLGWGRG